MKFYRITVLLFISLFISACGAPDAVSVKPESTKNIRTIAIIQLEDSPLRMINAGSGAAAFGAIGGAAIAAGSSEDKLQKILSRQNFDFSRNFTNDIKKGLAASGYKVVVIKTPRNEKHKLLESYTHINTTADAIMDVVVTNVGYVTENWMLSPHWRPEARAFIKMVNSKSGELIYQDTMMYGYHNPFMSGVDIDAPKGFQYENEEDVFKAGEAKIVEGLRDASRKMAQHVADKLKK